jgi:hypothetical protein
MRERPEDFRNQLRQGAEVNKLDPERVIGKVEAGLKPGLKPFVYFTWRAIRSGIFWPRTIRRNVLQIRTGAGSVHARTLIREYSLSLFYALFGVVLYLVLSGLASFGG